MTHEVRIDGKETTLTFASYSGSRGYQYRTPGNTASHAFPWELAKGMRFRTNGHDYEVLS